MLILQKKKTFETVRTYEFRKRPPTNYMTLEVADDDEYVCKYTLQSSGNLTKLFVRIFIFKALNGNYSLHARY